MTKEQALIYHITYREDWKRAQSQGFYRAPSLDTEGFIHCSMKNQVAATAQRFFKGQKGLVVLCIDTKSLTSEMKMEPPSHPTETPVGPEVFPHVYGVINISSVVATTGLEDFS
jgi:uncharacterized protein (DUF952 family)